MVKPPNILSRNTSSEAVEAEALAWIAQLDGDRVTSKDLAAFNEWVQRSPAHAEEITKLNGLWGDLNVLTEMIEPIAHADYASSQLRGRKPALNWKVALTAPALCIILIGGIFMSRGIAPQMQPNVTIETAQVKIPRIYKTEIGQRQEHTLDDGSIITLNTASRIEVDYRDDQRRIRLLQGEVLFDVAHDTSRPFLVFAGEGLVRAVGTAFVVRLGENDLVDVIVSEGAVELSSVLPAPSNVGTGADATNISNLGIIRSGHSATFEHLEASIAAISEKEMQAKLSWRNGFLTFSGETLDEVIREVSRYTELEIRFKDEDLMVLQLGGVFEAGDTSGLFTALRTNFAIDVDTSEPGIVTLARMQQ